MHKHKRYIQLKEYPILEEYEILYFYTVSAKLPKAPDLEKIIIENFLMPHPMDIIHYQGLVSSVPHHLKTLSGYSTGQFLNAEDELSFLTNLDFNS